MNESHFPEESPESSVGGPPLPRDADPPQFGAVDIVEAFTALRHEWRGQTKESRALAAQIEGAVARIQAVEARLAAGPVRRAAES
jgi:molecular chaperone GrpE